MKRQKLIEVIKAGRFEWRKRTLQRLTERGITRNTVTDALVNGKIIEDYPDDKPYPSALFLGWVGGKPLHIVVALDEKHHWAYIITTYEPNLKYFEADFKTRRKR